MEGLQKSMQNVAVSEKVPGTNSPDKNSFAIKRPAGTAGNPITVETNLRKINLTPNVPIYKYDVNVALIFRTENGEVSKELSKASTDSCENFRCKRQCRTAYFYVVEKNPNVFGDKSLCCFYDEQASLYTTKQLAKPEYQFELDTKVVTKQDAEKVVVTIRRVADSFQVTTNDVSKTTSATPENVDRTLLEALNTIISRGPTDNSDVVTLNGCSHYIFKNIGNLRVCHGDPYHTKFLANGLSKSVKPLEGENFQRGKSTPQLYLAAELKKSLFHEAFQKLSDKIYEIDPNVERWDYNSLDSMKKMKQFLNVNCYLHTKTTRQLGSDAQIYTIKGLGPAANSPASAFEHPTYGKVTIEQYFLRKYNTPLEYPHMVTVKAKSGKRKGFFPMEVLVVCENQLCRTDHVQLEEQAAAIKETAVRPLIRKEQTNAIMDAVGLSNITAGGMMNVDKKFAAVSARVLPQAEMVNGSGRVHFTDAAQWKGGKFTNPAKLGPWMFVFIDVRFAKTRGTAYVESITKKMTSVGMQFPKPTMQIIDKYDASVLENLFKTAKSKNVSFIYFVTRGELRLQDTIKSLERKYDILTQNNKEKVAEKAGSQTIENIVNKINIKNKGLNHTISNKNFFQRRIFVGFETSQRNGNSDTPVMIGYAANVMSHDQMFAGGYKYVKQHADVFGPVIGEIMREIIQQVRKNRNETPLEIFVYFNGVSEGQWTLINEVYLNHIKMALSSFDTEKAKFRPGLIILACSKTHNERMYKTAINPSDNVRNQNLPPGTVVDKTIVSPCINEFYLAAHSAIQGTTKSVKFSLIYDSTNKAMDAIEGLTHQLCFLHEIVNSTTSLPAPLLVADRFTKRAAAIYRESNFVRPTESTNMDEFIAKCNAELTYDNKSLAFTRFNA